MNVVFLLHIFSCWFMTGVIWIVQILIYPNFRIIGPLQFRQFHQFHLKRITWIVAPFMLAELLTACWIAYERPDILSLINFGSVTALWALTRMVNVPTHEKLKFEDQISQKNLSLKNWPRTILWTMRSICLFWMILERGFYL